jgi:molybdopterin-containing oxidoreductase family membrane subunit
MRLEDYITARHVDVMCKLVLTTSWMVGLAYATELFTAFWSGNPYESFAFTNRATGPFAWAYWIMVSCNVLVPQIFWSARLRRSFGVVFAASLLINVGMWFERFVIIVTSLHRDYLPSSWAGYTPTVIEIATLAGTFGLFFTCFLLFCRFLPAIAMAEVKGVLSPSPPAPLPPPPSLPGEGRKATDSPLSRVEGGRWERGARGVRSRRVLLSAFAREEDAMAAVRTLRREGYVIADVHAPYAVHGMETAAGLPPSRLGWVCGAAGFLGAASILGFQIWTSAVDWPLNVGGKPFNSLPAFVPVVFEVGVLLGGLATVAALLMRSRLWPGKKPARAYPGVTDDRFLVVVEETDAAFDPARVRRLCAELGAVAQEERLEEES